ncbi:MAG: 16S rRNA (uracil(1498)-N(3))-methyltransferase [Bacteroidales bacterium]|nr:16S rRNA (uracil(1498)-N(3))-methyltransferase [Bacteroidales bacterium]
MRRIFVKNIQGRENSDLVLRDAEHNHIASVLRMRAREQVIVICGDEFDYLYEISSIMKRETTLKFISKSLNEKNPKQKFTVYLAAIKNIDIAVTKLNEIGVSEIVVFESEHSNAKVNIEKLNTIAEQSCKQCERSIPVKVSGVIKFNELPAGAIYADFNGGKIIESKDIVIGPEGGFSVSERETLLRSSKPVSLGSRILRSETAAIVLSTLVLNKMGEI